MYCGNSGVMEYSYRGGLGVTKKTVVTSETSLTSFAEKGSKQNQSLVEMAAKHPSVFLRNDVNLCNVKLYAVSKMSSESFSISSWNDHCSTVYELSVSSKIIGRGNKNQRFIEHFTKSAGARVKQQFVIVMKEKPEFEKPQEKQEVESSKKKLNDVDILQIAELLKYPSDYAPKRKVSKANEKGEKVQKEKNKLNKTEVIASVDEDEDDSDEEYDEFEEEIVIVDIRRKPIWRKGLEIPKLPPEKVGKPIEDLLQISTLNTMQESCSDTLLVDEKIDYVESPPAAFAEFSDFRFWETF